MTLALVRAYLEVAILTTVGLAFTSAGWTVAMRLRARPRARTWLALGQGLLAASLVLPFAAHALLQPSALFRAPVMVESGAARTVSPSPLPAAGPASTAA